VQGRRRRAADQGRGGWGRRGGGGGRIGAAQRGGRRRPSAAAAGGQRGACGPLGAAPAGAARTCGCSKRSCAVSSILDMAVCARRSYADLGGNEGQRGGSRGAAGSRCAGRCSAWLGPRHRRAWAPCSSYRQRGQRPPAHHAVHTPQPPSSRAPVRQARALDPAVGGLHLCVPAVLRVVRHLVLQVLPEAHALRVDAHLGEGEGGRGWGRGGGCHACVRSRHAAGTRPRQPAPAAPASPSSPSSPSPSSPSQPASPQQPLQP
jgi:hypothetical protein